MKDLMPQPKRKQLTHVEQQTTRLSLRIMNIAIQTLMYVGCAALVIFVIVIAAGLRIHSW